MLNFVLQKIRSKKWMILCLLLGNILMIAIAASSPMYSQATLQRTLSRSLGQLASAGKRYPGTIVVKNDYHPSFSEDDSLSRIADTQAQLFSLQEALDLPVLEQVTQYHVPSLSAHSEFQSSDPDERRMLTLACYSDLSQHIRITHGEMFGESTPEDLVIPVIVNERTFVESAMVLGEEMELRRLTDPSGNHYRLKVVGIFEGSQPQDPYWVMSPSGFQDLCIMDQTLFREMFLTEENRKVNLNAEWYTVLDSSAIRADRVQPVLSALDAAEKSMDALGADTFQVYFRQTLADFLPEAAKLRATIQVLQAPVYVLLAAFVFIVSRQMLDLEQNEISVFKSRGASRLQIIRLYFLQSLLIALAGLAAGIPLGVLLCRLLGASNAFLEFIHRSALPISLSAEVLLTALGAALFSAAVMVLPVFRFARTGIVEAKRAKNRILRQPLWKLTFLDVICLAVSLYGLFQYRAQKDYLVQRVLEGQPMDPLLYLCSSLFMLGAGLLFLRLFPLLIRLIFFLGRRLWSPALYASFLRMIRTRDNQGFLIVFLVLTVSLGIFSARTARTVNANAANQIRYLDGADVVVQEIWDKTSLADTEAGSGHTVSAEPDFNKYLEIPGVEHAARVLMQPDVSVALSGNKTVSNATVMAIHTRQFGQSAQLQEGLLPLHWYEYLNAISQDPKAALLSSNFAEKYGVKLGDTVVCSCYGRDDLRLTVYGFVDYWPGFASSLNIRNPDGQYRQQEQFLVVSHLSQAQSVWGVRPYQVWMKVNGSTQPIYDYTREHGLSFSQFRDTSADLIAMKNDPVFQSTNGILTIGFIVVLLLCAAGFLLFWVLSIKSRTLQFGIFRAMGISMREILTMLISEQFFISGLSVGVGVLVGMLSSRLYIPLIQVAYSSADRVLPLEIVSQRSDLIQLGGVIGGMMLLCLVILGILISKIKITQALKLGED